MENFIEALTSTQNIKIEVEKASRPLIEITFPAAKIPTFFSFHFSTHNFVCEGDKIKENLVLQISTIFHHLEANYLIPYFIIFHGEFIWA